MRRGLFRALNGVLRPAGVQLVRNQHVPDSQLVRLLNQHSIDTVLDVGANTGQTGQKLIDYGYDGRIISFEPLSDAYEILLRHAAAYPDWTVYPRCALGDIDGEIQLNIAGNSQSSSVLSMLEAHLSAAPKSRYIGTEMVQMFRLDTIWPSLGNLGRVVLKMDAQGYEEKILDGAVGVIDQIYGIKTESSIVPLYDGEMLMPDMYQRLWSLGFRPCGIYNNMHGRDGELLQVDMVFMRPKD
jgi:FkbM family methyltransferase